ncbi:phage portal protein [Rhizobium ruizarguesonis]|jgi:HK97 family phage portal protein|uniref:phage portal protein n=1 Tax=Rhizobium TaxID=379 RepID=UPI001030B202|nr:MULTISPECIES: phage portal protein [Rhizobium]MBY2941421.1 phage portal protein [Rhizobium leguminosarum]MBY2961691.1 phage portal protein [Rhizobium leguminosarum]TAY93611.1 phage portal protein [Rhizobium ruizarguesonis]
MNIAFAISKTARAFGFRQEQKAYSLNSPDFADLVGVRPTYSSVNIGGQSALYVPAVLQAVRLISETVGSLPCKAYRETAGGKELAKAHSAYRIVHKRANEWTGAGDLRTRLTADALLRGNGYAKVVRFEDGRPFELHRLKPGKVTVLEDDVTGAPVYRVSEATGTRDYPHTEILHLPSFLATSPISFGKEGIGLASILERHGAQFFGSGARPTGIISNDKPQGGEAGAQAVGNIRKSFREWQKGGSGDPLILDAGWKYDQPAMTSTDAQFLEHRLEQVREIARIFGVPPTMLFELTRGTWSNTEQMGAQFLQLCLRPWLDRWTDAMTTVLLSEDEQDTHYFEFVTDDLMRADAASRTANMTALVTNRIMTPNEVRAILNLQPLPGGDELTNPHTTSSAAPTTPEPPREPA